MSLSDYDFNQAYQDMLGDYPMSENALSYLRGKWEAFRRENPDIPPLVAAQTLFRQEMERPLHDIVTIPKERSVISKARRRAAELALNKLRAPN